MEKIIKKQQSDRIFAALGFALLAIFGVLEATKGTMIPEIKAQFGVDYTAISTLLVMGSISYTLMIFLGGILSDIKGQKFVILIGCALTASSLFFIRYAQTFPAVCILFFTMYLGLGCFEVSSSLVARLNSKYSAIIMSLLHFSFGAGTICGPLFATSIVMNGGSWAQAFSLISIPILACLIVAAVVPFQKDAPGEPEMVRIKKIKLDRRIWTFIFILGISLVLEFGVVNWFVNYLQVGWGVDTYNSSTFITFFFVAFSIGRLVGGFITHKIGYYKTLLYAGIAMAVLFSIGIMLGSSGIACFIIFGFFVAVMFPTVMVGLMEEYKEKIASVMGIVISIASVINLFATWIMGLLNDHTSVVFGFNTLIFYILVTVALTFMLGRQNKKIREQLTKENIY